MTDVIDYLRWRGDLTMIERPFNEVDNLILSTLIYVDFKVIREKISGDKKMRVKDAVDVLLKEGYESMCLVEITREFLEELRDSFRFRNILISNYVEIYDKIKQCQFATASFILEDHTVYIAFRGTDKSIVGWRENFTMSFSETFAQVKAMDYLNSKMGEGGVSYRVGGHSKGGNLAVYAAAKCNKHVQGRIIEIYDNDGPGFCNEIVSQKELDDIKGKIYRFVPEFSVVGMLFDLNVPFKIVKSSEKRINEHNPLSWQVGPLCMVTCERLNPHAENINKTLKQWIENQDMDHRKSFVDEVFNAMEADGAEKLQDVVCGIEGIEKILTDMFKSDEKTKKVIKNLIGTIMCNVKNTNHVKLFQNKKLKSE